VFLLALQVRSTKKKQDKPQKTSIKSKTKLK